MDILKALLSRRRTKQKVQNPERRSLGVALIDWVAGLLLDTLKLKWDREIWEPGK
jgi:hypothetical protein